jgi:(2R)-ethylmalonyl-CoA mutase
VAAVFTPADFGITAIIGRIVDVIRLAHELQPWPGQPAAAAATIEG